MSTHVQGEQRTQNQEQRNDDNLQEDADDKILGRLVGILARQAALHQVLVKTCRGDNHEDTSNKLFPEVSALFGIIKEEDARRVISGNGLAQATEIITQTLGDKVDTQYH